MDRKIIKIKCPYCGKVQCVEIEGYYGDIVAFCDNFKCEKDFVVSWSGEPDIKVRKIVE